MDFKNLYKYKKYFKFEFMAICAATISATPVVLSIDTAHSNTLQMHAL